MALVVDASALYSQADAADPGHRAVAGSLAEERGPLITSQSVATEADHLILARLGVDIELEYLRDLASGTFAVECLQRDEIAAAREVIARYRDLSIGLGDASLVVLAHRYRTRRLLTFDERAFRAITPLQGGNFMILPADA